MRVEPASTAETPHGKSQTPCDNMKRILLLVKVAFVKLAKTTELLY
jgi:hypothetical protein